VGAALCVATAPAQVGGYAMFTGANLDVTTTTEANPATLPPVFITSTAATKIYGPTFGFYADLPTPVVQIGADFRGYLLNGSGKQHYSGVFGPRVAVNLPVVNLKPYAEFLFGFGSYKTVSSNATVHVDYEFVVGVDRKLISLLDWRVIEFSGCNYYGGSVPTRALATGLVVRIP
jgi:hypothetical protein